MLNLETGWYWYYSLDSLGEPIEVPGKPSICFYSSEVNQISFNSYDLSMAYDPKDYRLLKRLEYHD